MISVLRNLLTEEDRNLNWYLKVFIELLWDSGLDVLETLISNKNFNLINP